MRRTCGPAFGAVVAAGVLGLALSSCSSAGGATMSATAEFADIGSLAHGAAVEMAGINIGHVSHIRLSGARALLTLVFPKSAHVPADALAQVRRASILGPQVIELVVPPDAGSAPPLADGARIQSTDVRPDLEDLIKAGTDLIGALSTSQLARLVQEGAQSFGGEGTALHQSIDDLNTVMAGYASRTQTIATLINSLNSFASTVGPAAQADAQALSNLAQTAGILDAQRVRLTDLLASLDNVSRQGVAFLSTQLPQIGDQLLALRTTTQALANQQAALGKLLVYLQGHNISTSLTTNSQFVQVLNDFVVCGLPNHAGGDVPGSAVNGCGPAGTGAP